MPSFADQIKGAVVAAERAAGNAAEKRYNAVLDELAEGLGKLGVGARIVHGPDAHRHALHLFPVHRPSRATVALSFVIHGEDILIVSGKNPKPFPTPKALEAWLLDFVRTTPFLHSLQALREEATQPVEARLRQSAEGAYSKSDVVVTVSAFDQSRLGQERVGHPFEVFAKRGETTGNGPFSKTAKYTVLDSAGLLVEVTGVVQVKGAFKIDGVKLPSA